MVVEKNSVVVTGVCAGGSGGAIGTILGAMAGGPFGAVIGGLTGLALGGVTTGLVTQREKIATILQIHYQKWKLK